MIDNKVLEMGGTELEPVTSCVSSREPALDKNIKKKTYKIIHKAGVQKGVHTSLKKAKNRIKSTPQNYHQTLLK